MLAMNTLNSMPRIHRHNDLLSHFVEAMKSDWNVNACHALLGEIDVSLCACIHEVDLNLAVHLIDETSALAKQYDASSLVEYNWIKKINSPTVCIDIMLDFITVVINSAWNLIVVLDTKDVENCPHEKIIKPEFEQIPIQKHRLKIKEHLMSKIVLSTIDYSAKCLLFCRMVLNANSINTSLLNALIDGYLLKISKNQARLNSFLSGRCELNNGNSVDVNNIMVATLLIDLDRKIKQNYCTNDLIILMQQVDSLLKPCNIPTDNQEYWFNYYEEIKQAFADLLLLEEKNSENLKKTQNKKIKNKKPKNNCSPIISSEARALSSQAPRDDGPAACPRDLKPQQSMGFFTCKSREALRKAKKKTEKKRALIKMNAVRIDRSVACITPELDNIFDELNKLFQEFLCDGYMYGSGNYKTNPNDFDIVILNICKPDDLNKVYALIERLICLYSAKLNCKTTESYRYGYKNVAGKHVIKIFWAQCYIDFTISDKKSFMEHAAELDFTINAMYLDFSDKTIYRLASIFSEDDLNNAIVDTITDPLMSFKQDPTRIFRGIRLVAECGFQFSTRCEVALQQLFAEEQGVFDTLKLAQVNTKLDLIFRSASSQKHLSELARLGGVSVLCRYFENTNQIMNGTTQQYYHWLQLLDNNYNSPAAVPFK